MGFWRDRWEDIRGNFLWQVVMCILGGGLLSAIAQGIWASQHVPFAWGFAVLVFITPSTVPLTPGPFSLRSGQAWLPPLPLLIAGYKPLQQAVCGTEIGASQTLNGEGKIHEAALSGVVQDAECPCRTDMTALRL